MKKSELKQIIKEEIKKFLSEGAILKRNIQSSYPTKPFTDNEIKFLKSYRPKASDIDIRKEYAEWTWIDEGIDTATYYVTLTKADYKNKPGYSVYCTRGVWSNYEDEYNDGERTAISQPFQNEDVKLLKNFLNELELGD